MLGGIKVRTKTAPSKVENRVVITVGKIIEAGAALPSAVRIPIIEVGISCSEVAFNTNSIHEAYSAFFVLSSSCAAFTPYGVAAPEMPRRLTDKFIQTASSVGLSSVQNTRFATGLSSLETPRETPLSSQTRISPSHTE